MQRRVAVGIVCVASAAALSACGFEAPSVTDHEHSEVQGTSFQVGADKVRAAYITTPISAGAAATPYLVVTFVNDGRTADTFTGATTPIGTVTLSGAGTSGGQLKLPPGVPAQLLDPGIDSNGALAMITTSKAPAVGTYVQVRFNFATAGSSVTEQVPVVPPGETTAATTPLPVAPAPVPTQVGDTTAD